MIPRPSVGVQRAAPFCFPLSGIGAASRSVLFPAEILIAKYLPVRAHLREIELRLSLRGRSRAGRSAALQELLSETDGIAEPNCRGHYIKMGYAGLHTFAPI